MTDTAPQPYAKAIQWVITVAGMVISAVIIGSFALLLSIDRRMIRMETIVDQSKAERQSQIETLHSADRELARRMGELEKRR